MNPGMRAKTILSTLGIVLALLGIIFLAQGRGWLRYPSDSFMVGDPAWVNYGTVIAVAGLLMILLARRMR